MARTHTSAVAIAAVALVVLAPLSATTVAAASATTTGPSGAVTTATTTANDTDAGAAALSVADIETTSGDDGPGSAAAADGAGAATAGDAPSASPPGDEPVLLVHGFADVGYTPWWAEMTDDLADAGYDHGDVFVLNLGAVPLSTIDSPEDYASAVCDAIRTVQDRTGADEVDVVAHSMGGLDARYCIEKQGGAANVDDLVTLGTPHQGTYAAYLAYLTPGGRDMVPGSDFLDDLNDGDLAAGVEYTAVWSDWDTLIDPDEYAKLPEEERESVATARNVFVDDSLHTQLVWDDDVFDAWIEHLD